MDSMYPWTAKPSVKTLIMPLWIKDKRWTVELECKAMSVKVSPINLQGATQSEQDSA